MKGELCLDSYTATRTLGSGQSATVFLLEDDSGHKYAGKVLVNSDACLRERNMALLHREAHILSSLNSNKVVKLHAAKDNGVLNKGGVKQHCSYLVLEYCEGGELYDYVHDSGRFSEELTRWYFGEVVKAVTDCHVAGVAHCDIKLDNILLDFQYRAKLADFGLAVKLDMCKGGSLQEYKGTPFYMAPEIHARRAYNAMSADIFALGVCLFIMMTRTCPFKSATSTDDHYTLFLNDNARYWRMYSQLTQLKIPTDFIDLVNNLLALDPSHRLSLAEIMAHPWMQGPLPTDVERQMRTRKTAIDRIKADRHRMETELRSTGHRLTQASSTLSAKPTDYNELVDELVSQM